MLGWIAIFVGGIGLWLAAKHNIGWLIGVLCTLLWYLYAIPIHAWPVIGSASLYGIIDFRNFIIGLKNEQK